MYRQSLGKKDSTLNHQRPEQVLCLCIYSQTSLALTFWPPQRLVFMAKLLKNNSSAYTYILHRDILEQKQCVFRHKIGFSNH